MKLRMWSVNPDGVVIDDTFLAEVIDREQASGLVAAELCATASDLFLHNALTEWFTTGKIHMLSESVDDTAFWNVELLDD